MSDEQTQPDDTMGARVAGNPWKLWFLIGANRWVASGVLAGVVFLSIVLAGWLQPLPVMALFEGSDPVDTLFQALLGAIITGVTLVVTLNQLVLSQELGAVGDQRERMTGAMTFRRDVEAILDSTAAPPEPAAFLRALVDATADRADDLAAAVQDAAAHGEASEEFVDAVETYRDSVVGNATAVGNALEGGQFGTFDVIYAALDYNYSWKLYAGRRLRNEYATDAPAGVDEAFADLEAVLELFGPAREHFKTLYFEWELVDLSRAILTAAIPGILVSTIMILYFDTTTWVEAGSTLGVANAFVVIAAAVTISVLPFLILVVYIVRIATVSKRTLSIGAFVLRETDREVDLDW